MSSLTADHLLSRRLDARWGTLLDSLARIDELRRGPALTKDDRRSEARALYGALLNDLEAFVTATPAEHAHDSESFRAWFTESVLLWSSFAKTGSAPLIDTVGTETLKAFPVDLPLDDEAAARVRAAVKAAFDWNDADFAHVEKRVQHLVSNLELKREITAALQRYVSEHDLLSEAGRVELLRAFYGDVPLRPGDVDIVLVSTAVFFFVPRKGSRLETDDFESRPADEKKALRAFFEKLDLANRAETKRFPSFGLYEPEALSGRLVEALARAAGSKPSVVKDTLATMFSLIPTRLRAQYLVHDLWGHTWQEALNEFEWEYALLPKLDSPLAPDDGPEFGGDGAPTLRSAFVAKNGKTEVDEARLLAFAEADLRGRIQIATSVPLSEILADFMESKFSRVVPRLELPTSSLIPSTSLKIDLTIADTRAQVLRYAAPYRALAVNAADQRRLADGLAADGLPADGLRDAVNRAGRLMWKRFEPAFEETIRPAPVDEDGTDIASSVLRRLLIQFSLIMAALERALDWARPGTEGRAWGSPATSPDLFALALTHFYEQNRQRNVWLLDQIARHDFRPGAERLATKL